MKGGHLIVLMEEGSHPQKRLMDSVIKLVACCKGGPLEKSEVSPPHCTQRAKLLLFTQGFSLVASGLGPLIVPA